MPNASVAPARNLRAASRDPAPNRQEYNKNGARRLKRSLAARLVERICQFDQRRGRNDRRNLRRTGPRRRHKGGYKVCLPLPGRRAPRLTFSKAFVSPRNSPEGQISLFDAMDCRFIYFPRTHAAMVQPWLQQRDMKAVPVGPLDVCFPREDAPLFPYKKTLEEAEWDPFVVLHTSGSTGIPKPIICRQGMIAISNDFRYLPSGKEQSPGYRYGRKKSTRQFIPMPLYHAAGLYLFMFSVMYCGLPVALGMGNRPLSADQVVQCLGNADVESCVLPPVILEEMSRDPEQIKSLSRLNIVAFGSGKYFARPTPHTVVKSLRSTGSLAKAAGDRLVQGRVPLVNIMSTTEFFPFPLYLRPNPELWQYFIANPDVFGWDWRLDESGVGAHRLVIKRQGEKPGLQGFFYTFPDSQVSDGEAPGINVESEDALIDSIRDVFRTRPGGEGLEPDNDFFSDGVNSLQEIGAARLLKSGLEAAGFHAGAAAMSARVIYSNPTPRRLAQYILSVLRGEGEAAPGGRGRTRTSSHVCSMAKVRERLAPAGKRKARSG
ncbi:hypothetical protein DL765_010890 [Monosporascus sp. GIB2]|nr:hypothetical protein DL765_010890 [Monosporascus sp. GIB2]